MGVKAHYAIHVTSENFDKLNKENKKDNITKTHAQTGA
jgi:predicted RND superfamily exporter protein